MRGLGQLPRPAASPKSPRRRSLHRRV